MKTALIVLFTICCIPDQPFAQNEGQRTQQLINELKSLTNQAERDRTASFRFIDQLRELTARFDRPRGKRIIFDNFTDGELQRNPAWNSNSRNFRVTRNIGLLTQLNPTQADQPATRPNREQLLLGMLLEGALKNQQPASQTTDITRVDISTQARISNAFSITIKLSSLARYRRGSFEWGPYQGQHMESGYRLLFQGGTHPALKLLSYRRGLASVIEQHIQENMLEDGNSHKITWRRMANGLMTVFLDGRQVMQVHDRSYINHFNGLVMTNRGGDYGIRSVSVFGTN